MFRVATIATSEREPADTGTYLRATQHASETARLRETAQYPLYSQAASYFYILRSTMYMHVQHAHAHARRHPC